MMRILKNLVLYLLLSSSAIVGGAEEQKANISKDKKSGEEDVVSTKKLTDNAASKKDLQEQIKRDLAKYRKFANNFEQQRLKFDKKYPHFATVVIKNSLTKMARTTYQSLFRSRLAAFKRKLSSEQQQDLERYFALKFKIAKQKILENPQYQADLISDGNKKIVAKVLGELKKEYQVTSEESSEFKKLTKQLKSVSDLFSKNQMAFDTTYLYYQLDGEFYSKLQPLYPQDIIEFSQTSFVNEMQRNKNYKIARKSQCKLTPQQQADYLESSIKVMGCLYGRGILNGFKEHFIDLFILNKLLYDENFVKIIANQKKMQEDFLGMFSWMDISRSRVGKKYLVKYADGSKIRYPNSMDLMMAYHHDFVSQIRDFKQVKKNINALIYLDLNRYFNLPVDFKLSEKIQKKLFSIMRERAICRFEAIVPQYNLKEKKLFEKPFDLKAVAKPKKLTKEEQEKLIQALYSSSVDKFCGFVKSRYPFLALKKIDWDKITKEALLECKNIKNDKQFCLFMIKLVAKLEDSHAYVMPGTSPMVRDIKFPNFTSGFACLEDKKGDAVVYFLNPRGSAFAAGLKAGNIIKSINGVPTEKLIKERENLLKTYSGWSSERYLHYSALRSFDRVLQHNQAQKIVAITNNGKEKTFNLTANMNARYINRLPVPIENIYDSGNVSWTNLGDDIGYIYVRRIRRGLEQGLDKALKSFGEDIKGLIIDVRGNSGGGFDTRTAYVNFDVDNVLNSSGEMKVNRPLYKGKIAVLIDQRCISAGEGWSSWFKRYKRAKFFGQTTAGASARKIIYPLDNDKYKVRIPIKGYRGFLTRLIERRGIEPDYKVDYEAKDIAKGRDTILEAAKKWLIVESKAVGQKAVDVKDSESTVVKK